MKATVKGRYEGDKAKAVATLAVPAGGDLRLKASATDATFARGPSLQGLNLTLEKPSSFLLALDAHTKDVRFQFMNTARLWDKSVSLTYTHSTCLAPAEGQASSRVVLDCGVTFDSANKVSVNHSLGSSGCRVKYVYMHGVDRRTTVEPSFATAKNAWDFAVTRKLEGGDAVKATYNPSTRLLGLEWSRDSKINGSFKIVASFDLNEENRAPKLIAESVWNYEI